MTHSFPLARPSTGFRLRQTPSGTSQVPEVPDRGGEGDVSNPATERLSVQTVEYLHRLLGGEAGVEGMVLRFIADRYGVKSLLHLPPHVAKEIIKRPGDFVQAAKRHCEPELNF